jgi:hypothetical protein
VTARDVVFVGGDGDRLYDDRARAWDARTLRPLTTTPPTDPPLVHKTGCRMTPWPDLADMCTCTAALRWLRQQRRHHTT